MIQSLHLLNKCQRVSITLQNWVAITKARNNLSLSLLHPVPILSLFSLLTSLLLTVLRLYDPAIVIVIKHLYSAT